MRSIEKPAQRPDEFQSLAVRRLEVTIANAQGLHARPAASLATALASVDAEVRINGVDACSVLMLLTLGAAQGETLQVEACGPESQEALEVVKAHVESKFGEW